MAQVKRIEVPEILRVPSRFLDRKNPKKAQRKGSLLIFGVEDRNALAQELQAQAPSWKLSNPQFFDKESFLLETQGGPLWILFRKRPRGPFSHQGLLEETDFVWFRDQAGLILQQAKSLQLEILELEFRMTEPEMERGVCVGLELAAYSYKNLIQSKEFEGFPFVQMKKRGGSFDTDLVEEASILGQSMNLARHLVNIPPNFLNPTQYARFFQNSWKSSPGCKVEVWGPDRLKKEGMGLHLGVGQGSEHGPCLVHFRSRDRKVSSRPVAFVGKGITFDTGGLDLKPSSAMRLMKKDMGGSACVAAVAWYLKETRLPVNCDVYLALAENSVDSRAMRPSDVLQARNGQLVEIHNTDAEGRLVLADVLDVAVTQKGSDEPEVVVDVATLTGAIKTALGAEIAGLFSNQDDLADSLQKAGQRVGDLCWRMPLYNRYTSNFSSSFADMVNATDGFGGAITAALFLERFVRQKPWAHLDIYAWNDKASGSFSFSGGNGQAVNCLVEWLRSRSETSRPVKRSRKKKAD